VTPLEEWVGDEDAWRRMRSYATHRTRYCAIEERLTKATTAAARLLSKAARRTPPVDITDASSEKLLSHLCAETGVSIGQPLISRARPTYTWPYDGSGLTAEAALDDADARVSSFESFVSSNRTESLVARYYALLERYRPILLERLTRSPNGKKAAAALSTRRYTIGEAEMMYGLILASEEDRKSVGPVLPQLYRYLSGIFEARTGDELWLDTFSAGLTKSESDLDDYMRRLEARSKSTPETTAAERRPESSQTAANSAVRRRPWWRPW
jgi:hypothetical protein